VKDVWDELIKVCLFVWYLPDQFGWRAFIIFLAALVIIFWFGILTAPRFEWVWLYCITHKKMCYF
jgi:hypothetical protein